MKLTYIMGAGASFPTHPITFEAKHSSGIISGLRESMDSSCVDFEKFPTYDATNKIKDRIKEIAEAAKDFRDIDTYAKYLWLKGNYKQLNKVKQAIADYFRFEILVKSKVEPKYLSWLVNLASESRFPENVKVLT